MVKQHFDEYKYVGIVSSYLVWWEQMGFSTYVILWLFCCASDVSEAQVFLGNIYRIPRGKISA